MQNRLVAQANKAMRRKRAHIQFFFEEGIDPHVLSEAIALMFGRILRPLVWARPTGMPYFEGERVEDLPC